jgi:hypothetical protein
VHPPGQHRSLPLPVSNLTNLLALATAGITVTRRTLKPISGLGWG